MSAAPPAASQPAVSTSQPRPPLPPPGEMDRCLALIKAKRYEEARVRLGPIVDDHPDWPRANFFLALTFHKENRYELARPLFERVLALDPKYHTARPFYGWCLYYLGNAAESRKQFEAYLNVKPNYADAHYAIGLIEYDRDKIDAARERFETAIRLAKTAKDRATEGKSRARLGDVFIRLDHLENAKRELELAVTLRPDAYEAYFKLSRVLQRLGDEVGAAKAREMHLKIREMLRPSIKSPMESGDSRDDDGTQEP